MPKASPAQVAFNAGQLAESFHGRADHEKYSTGCKILENFIPQVQGPIAKRTGTRFVSEVKNSAVKARLVPFQFSTEQAYVLEFGGGYARVFAGGEDALGTDTDGGTIVWPSGALDVRGATAANPVVITYDVDDTDIRLQDGVTVRLQNLGGMVEVNDREFIIENLDEKAGTFELQNEDGTAHTAYTSGGTIDFGTNIGLAVEFAIPYTETQIFEIQWAQSADTLYIAQRNTPPQKIERRAHYLWKCSEIEFDPPPFAAENDDDGLKLTASHREDTALGGDPPRTGVRITATGGDPFTAAMVGSFVRLDIDPTVELSEWRGVYDFVEATNSQLVNGRARVGQAVYQRISANGFTTTGRRTPAHTTPGLNKDDNNWTWQFEDYGTGYGKIFEFEDSKNVLINVKSNDSSLQNAKLNFFTVTTFDTDRWAISAWNATAGYPRAVTFYEDRLWWGGTTKFPNTLWGSRFGDYENHDVDDTTESGQTWTINDDQVNMIEWMSAGDVLSIGTSGGEFVAKGLNPDESISGENPLNPVRNSQYGSRSSIPPIRAEDVVLFVQRAGRKVREFVYQFETDRYVAPDLSILAEDQLDFSIAQWAYQQEPQRTVWVVMENGTLRTFTYERSQNVVGWTPQRLGGRDVKVLSVASIPHPDDTPGDQVWFVVERTINGKMFRSIEYLEQEMTSESLRTEAFYVDSGLSRDEPQTWSAVLQSQFLGDPDIVFTKASHGYSEGDLIYFEGLTKPSFEDREAGVKNLHDLVEGKRFWVNVFTANQFALRTTDGVSLIDPTGYNVDKWDGVGHFHVLTSTVTGLEHLEGEEVAVLGDGAAQPNKVVSSGAITLERPAGHVHVGLPYQAKYQSMRIEAGAADGAAQGKKKRIDRVQFRLLRTGAGLHYGATDWLPDMDEVFFRTSYDLMGEPVPLFSGDTERLPWPGGYETDGLVTARHNTPLPCTISAVMLDIVTEDG